MRKNCQNRKKRKLNGIVIKESKYIGWWDRHTDIKTDRQKDIGLARLKRK